MSHITDGRIHLPAGDSDLFDEVVALALKHLPADELANVESVYGSPPNVQAFTDLLAVHELAHAHQFGAGIEFEQLWAGELFCNLALQGYEVEVEPESRSKLETLPQGARHIPPDAVALWRLDNMYDRDPLNYGWFQLHQEAVAIDLWASSGPRLLRQVFEQGQRAASKSRPVQVGELPPEIHRVAAEWPKTARRGPVSRQ